MAKFTEGPLAIEAPPSSSGFGRAIYARREDGPDVFVAYVGNWKQSPSTEVADAELFAASHRMLEALRNVVLSSRANDHGSLMNAIGVAEEIVQEFEGEEKPFDLESPKGRAGAEGQSYG